MDRRTQELVALFKKNVTVTVDRPIGYRHGDIVYPINYGYLPNVPADDGEDQDVYILGVSQPLSSFDGQVIGAIRRHNDCEDKLIVAPVGTVFHQGEIAVAVHFQEQYFSHSILSVFEKSCGVLPYRQQDGIREFLIVHEAYSHCWSLPKGHMEAGETEAETALRELMEETGLVAQLDTTISAAIEYPISAVARKQVVFFPGKVRGIPKTRDGEIQSFRWITEEQFSDYLFPDTAAACRTILQAMAQKST